ncbi:MAG: hypothetical protein ACI4JM_06935, partial [Oscillospiraceae bacterium]
FGIRQLFEKSWAKTFGFVILFTCNILFYGSTTELSYFVLPVNNAKLTNAVEPVIKVNVGTKRR